FLLENRGKKGNDESLPAHGLLIWRVVNNKPILEESHGVEGPSGPRVYLNAVPYPSAANDSFTPYTTPSSRAQLGNGLPVHITNIRRLPDGRITFYIGYEYEYPTASGACQRPDGISRTIHPGVDTPGSPRPPLP